MSALNARVNILELGDRIDDSDSENATITRTFLCCPFTAHRRVETALKGTISPAIAGNYAGAWQRNLPHKDPLNHWFYLTHTVVAA